MDSEPRARSHRRKRLALVTPWLVAMTFVMAACSSPPESTSPPAVAPGETLGRAALPAAAETPGPTTATAIPPKETLEAAASPVATETLGPTTTSAEPLSSASSEGQESGAELVSRLSGVAWDNLVALTEDFSPRASATAQERAAAEYLLSKFREMGYESELQSFTVDLLSRDSPLLSLTSPEAQDVDSFPMQLTGTGRVSGVVVDAGKAFPEDIPADGLHGKIALIQRGTITFEEKIARVSQAGATAAIVYNNRLGLFGGRLQSQAKIPVVVISRESGREIKEAMALAPVEGTVSVVYETRETANVVAKKPGTAGDGGVVVLGGHYDTVPNLPGVNDNGSGIATLLAIASDIAAKSYPFTLRFVAFGSEEVGLYGSRHYVDSLTAEERADVLAMLNFDALATGDVTGVLGSRELLDAIVDYGVRSGIDVERQFGLEEGTSSDHASFDAAGIPVVFFLADDFSRIHTPEDTLEFAQPERMGTSAALTLGLLDWFANRPASE